MPDVADVPTELHDINSNLVKLNETILNSTLTIYRGKISAAKIQAAQNLFDRNTTIKEAEDYLDKISVEINQNGGQNG